MNKPIEVYDFRRRLDDSPMSRVQIMAVAVTVLLSALDGYDVLSMTFAAPAVTKAWGIDKTALGGALSSSLAGMALGSLLLAPLGDVIGRRLVVMGGLVLMTAGSLLSAYSSTVLELALWRVLTGLGIGIMVAVITALAAEFANTRRRPFAVAAMAVGYPVGGVIGGLVAAALLRSFGWPAVFMAGAVAGAVVLLAVVVSLPESPAFLLARRKPNSLERINVLLVRCGHPPVAALPPLDSTGAASYRALFSPGCAGTTVWITAVNLLYVVAVYYILSWMPQLVADAGFSPASGSIVSSVANVVGVFSGMALGWAAASFAPNRLAACAMVGLGLAIAAFGYMPASLPLLMMAAGVVGFFLFAGIAGLYATMAAVFTPATRSTGSGFVIGIGRAGSAIGPYLAGWLFTSGLTRAEVSVAFAALAGVAGILLAFGRPRPTI